MLLLFALLMAFSIVLNLGNFFPVSFSYSKAVSQALFPLKYVGFPVSLLNHIVGIFHTFPSGDTSLARYSVV